MVVMAGQSSRAPGSYACRAGRRRVRSETAWRPGRRVLGWVAPWRQLPSGGAVAGTGAAGTAAGDAARLDVDRPAAAAGLLPISRRTAARTVSTSCSATRRHRPQTARPCFPSEAGSRAVSAVRRAAEAVRPGGRSRRGAWCRWRPCRPGCSSSRSPCAAVPRWLVTRPVGRPTGRDRCRGRPGPGQRSGPCFSERMPQ